MASKREVLEQLKRDELVSALDRYGLEVRDRRVRDDLVTALAGSRKASLAEIVGELSRTRLKEICRALDLDDSGREKALLIERLTGQAGASKPAATTPGPSPAAPPAPAPAQALTPGPFPRGRGEKGKDKEKEASGGLDRVLTREALERHLWSAADILRGSIDSSDYKNYILGLLFLKRLSDRFDEECEIVRQEGGDPEDPDEHQFYVPPLAR